jgi:hypothetical protein
MQAFSRLSQQLFSFSILFGVRISSPNREFRRQQVKLEVADSEIAATSVRVNSREINKEKSFKT